MPPRGRLADVVAVAYASPSAKPQAQQLAARLGLALAKGFRDPHPLHLVVNPAEQNGSHRLEVQVVEKSHPLANGHGVFSDFAKLDTASPAGRSLKSPLFRAVGAKSGKPRPHVFDATAGLGEDTWLLAAAGCTVTACERQPVVHALLENALRRARDTADHDTAGRITLLPCGDAAAALATADAGFDVVMIDPMFPGHKKRKTAERKPLRVLRWLAGDDPDADNLWDAARGAAKHRVVVKRPRHAPPLAGQTPAVSQAGRGFRFDVYPTAAKK